MGVSRYVTVSLMLPLLMSVWLIEPAGVGSLIHPVTLAELGVQVQVNRVPVMFEVRLTAVFTLLHCTLDGGLFDRSGVGKTVTV